MQNDDSTLHLKTCKCSAALRTASDSQLWTAPIFNFPEQEVLSLCDPFVEIDESSFHYYFTYGEKFACKRYESDGKILCCTTFCTLLLFYSSLIKKIINADSCRHFIFPAYTNLSLFYSICLRPSAVFMIFDLSKT